MITLTGDDRLSLREVANTINDFKGMFIEKSGTFKRLDNQIRFLRDLADRKEETVCTKIQLLEK